jgi:hypothetical protein
MGDNSFSDNLKSTLGITSSNVFGYAECIDNADPLRISELYHNHLTLRIKP